MKTNNIVVLLAALLLAAPVKAQSESSFSEGISQLWKKTKKAVNKTTLSIKEEFNVDNAGAELIQIDGHKYMPLRTNDLWKSDEADDFKEACRKEFLEKYPEIDIVSVVIPQTDWTDTTIRSNGKISKYLKVLYCYILAKDGDDGYINARFSFRQVKPVGGQWKNDEDYWPLWERTDVIVPSVYKRLTEIKD